MRVDILFYNPDREPNQYFDQKLEMEKVPSRLDKIKGPDHNTYIVSDVIWYPFVIDRDPYVELTATRTD